MTTQQPSRPTTPHAHKPGFKGKRAPRKMTASMEEAIKLLKPLRGRNKIFGMMSTNDRGTVTEVGVYNGITKKFALYRAELVDAEVLAEFKTLIG